jgi:hypothetical protein
MKVAALGVVAPEDVGDVVGSTGCMYSPAGTGEYSRTSIAPRRSASEPIADETAVLSRMSAGAKSAVIPSCAMDMRSAPPLPRWSSR